MKVPKTFIPEKNLDEKVRDMILESDYKEEILEEFDKKLSMGDKKYDYYCDECGENAGNIEIYFGMEEDLDYSKISCWPTCGDEDPWKNKPRIITKSYMGECTIPKDPDELIEIMTYLENDELDAVLAIFRGDNMAFYCPNCDKCYCGDHWDTMPVYEADGWYDYTMGTCPKGHERMVDD